MKRSLYALLAIAGATPVAKAGDIGFFEPTQRHAASYDALAPQTFAAELRLHRQTLTEDRAADRRDAREERYDARVASKLLNMGEWSLGLNLESTQVDATAPVQKRSDLRLYGLAPWISVRLGDQWVLAHQESVTFINEEDESFAGTTGKTSRHVRQEHTSLAFRPVAGTELGLAYDSAYQKDVHGFTLETPARYAIFVQNSTWLPARIGAEAAVLNHHALHAALHDAYSFDVFTAVPLASFLLDARAGYQTGGYHEASTLTAQTMDKVTGELGGRYGITDKLQVGASVAVVSGQAEKNGRFIDQKDWSLQLKTQLSL